MTDKNFFQTAAATPVQPVKLPPAPRQTAQPLWFRTYFGYADGWLFLLIAAIPLWLNLALPGNGLAPLAQLPGKATQATVEIADCMKSGGTYVCMTRGNGFRQIKSRVDYSPATYGPEAAHKTMSVLRLNAAPGIMANPDFSLYISTIVLFGISALALLLACLSFLRKSFSARHELNLLQNGTAVPAVFLKTEPELPTTSQTYKYYCTYTLPNGQTHTVSREVQNIQFTRRLAFTAQEGEVLAVPREYVPEQAGATPITDTNTATPTGGQELVLYNPADPRQAALYNVPGYDLEPDPLGRLDCPGSALKLSLSMVLALVSGLLVAGACMFYLNLYMGAR